MKKALKYIAIVVGAFLAFSIVMIILIGVTNNFGHGLDTSDKSDHKTTSKNTSKAKGSLAADVQKHYLDIYGYKTITDLNMDKDNTAKSPNDEVTKFEDAGNGDVRVYVQDTVTDEEATQIGSVAFDCSLKGLDWIIVQDYHGVDHNAKSRDSICSD